MEDEIERLVIGVRADTASFARDVDTLRASLDGPLASGVARAGRAIDGALGKALASGSLGFEDLRKTALAVLADIAAAAVRGGVAALLTGAGGGLGGGGLIGTIGTLLSGSPGRATGGPVSPARPYWVGERGPELFVPTSSGSVVAPGASGAVPRDVRVSITVQGGSDAPQALAASSRQVARAVKAALS